MDMRKTAVKIQVIFLMVLFLASCKYLSDTSVDDSSGASSAFMRNGNSTFHNTDPVKLEVSRINLKGEVSDTGEIDLSKLYKREVFIKENFINNENKPQFVGAFRYIGYSLFDILNAHILQKQNAKDFPPIVDAYIVVANDKGEKVSFSWSEVFLTNNPHQVIIATEVAQVKPHKKEVNYPTGNTWKLVSAGDLFANRMLENPTTISVISFNKKEYPINRNIKPLYSENLIVIKADSSFSIPLIKNSGKFIEYNTTFYGMGMGYHPNPVFKGMPLKTVLSELQIPFGREWFRNGLVCFASIDGYRAIYSYSELFNRADQVIPILAIPDDVFDGGYYRIFLPADFYADRSVKALSEIFFFMD